MADGLSALLEMFILHVEYSLAGTVLAWNTETAIAGGFCGDAS